MMKNILFLLIVILVMVPTVRAVSVELLENTDQCTFKNDIDHCFSKYLLCSNTTIKTQDIKFVFRDMEREYITKDELGYKLDYEFETEKKENCYEVSITGWKNPYINIDNILCYGDICFYKYAWWNRSYDYKIPFYCYCPHCSVETDMVLLASNSTYNIGVYINGFLEIFWVNITGINSSWKICAWIYYNDETDYVMVDIAETSRIEMSIDEGSGTNYGNPYDANTVGVYHLNGTDLHDSSIYNRDGSNLVGALITDGQIGNGMFFDNTNDQFQIDNIYDTTVNSGSLSFWINYTSGEEDWFLEKRLDGNNYFHLRVDNAGLGIYVFNKVGGANKWRCYGQRVTLNEWAFVYVNWTTTACTVYINATYKNPLSTPYNTGGVGGFDANWFVGLGRDGTQAFGGIIDYIVFRNKTLTTDEIILMYNNTIGTHNVTQFGVTLIKPPLPPIPIHSFIVFKLINLEIPFISQFLETLTFKSIIFFMDRLTVLGNVIIGGNLQVDGIITAENVFIPAYVFAHTNTTIAVASAGTWYNVPFDEEPSGPKSRITHTHNDNTNDTFTIQDDGTYNIHYAMSFSDASPSPTSHIVMRVVKNGVEIKGSLLEEDSTKQYSDFTISNGPIVELVTGDEIKFQFASDDTDVSLTSHRTYGEHHDLGVVKIIRIE